MRYSRFREARLASARRMDARHPGWTERMIAGPTRCACNPDEPTWPGTDKCPACHAKATRERTSDDLSRDCEYFADAQRED